MGQKINPTGFRVGIIRGHDSHWFYHKKQYRLALVSDDRIRKFLKNKIGKGLVSRVEIERAANRIKVTIFTSRPGAVIGRGGKGIDELSRELNEMMRKDDPTAQVQVNVSEVRQPELDAQLVAENIAFQLERRISHRRAMRQAMMRAQRLNGRGMKIMVAGRLNGAEIARSDLDKFGKVPLHTLRADIDYGFATAFTVYGSVGVKVWVYKGEVLPEKQLAQIHEGFNERSQRRAEGRGGDRPRGDRPYGDRPRGDRPYGDRPQGDRPPRPQGDRPYGGGQGGQRPYGDRPQGGGQGGPRPYGDRPQGDRGPRPQGDRPYGGGQGAPRPQGDRVYGDRGPRTQGQARPEGTPNPAPAPKEENS
jgi:small subunit ribosomal protein S3